MAAREKDAAERYEEASAAYGAALERPWEPEAVSDLRRDCQTANRGSAYWRASAIACTSGIARPSARAVSNAPTPSDVFADST